MKTTAIIFVWMAIAVSAFAGKPKPTPTPAPTPVTVGVDGNEPIIAAAPDGTLYISALQHIYSSTDSGTTWRELLGPIYASSINLNSDSSISVDPGNRLYFTFDYPYAGTTAVCTSDDRGVTWNCNPAVVPGGTDRTWTLAPTMTDDYETTNEGLYETAFLHSTDRGSTWTPTALGAGLLEPQTGPLLQVPGSSNILQITKIFGTLPQETPQLKVYVYSPNSTGSIIAAVRSTGLPLPVALPSAALGKDGQLWVASEEPNPAGGVQVVLAHSADQGVTWSKLPPLPGTTTGTATFTWVAAGSSGHVGVIYYYTPDDGADTSSMSTSTWAAMWAETFNADSPTPTWSVRVVQPNVHTGAICAASGCSGDNRFAGDFINAIIDTNDVAHLAWMVEDMSTQATTIRYERIQSSPPTTTQKR
ncbi:MAG TPA: sialidase family protein [Chthoniobacterales bacterium]|jgi:hypothetical protein|nr:sialidase family protein [Chthoniobacterales bacterium]